MRELHVLLKAVVVEVDVFERVINGVFFVLGQLALLSEVGAIQLDFGHELGLIVGGDELAQNGVHLLATYLQLLPLLVDTIFLYMDDGVQSLKLRRLVFPGSLRSSFGGDRHKDLLIALHPA